MPKNSTHTAPTKATAAPHWVPAAQHTPDGEPVLIWYKKYKYGNAAVAFFDRSEGLWYLFHTDASESHIAAPDYWCPLPTWETNGMGQKDNEYQIPAKCLEPREGYINRHKDGLPNKPCAMRIVVNDVEGDHVFLCDWKPYAGQYPNGHLGSALVIEGIDKGISFHAWEQNNSEFVWYAVV